MVGLCNVDIDVSKCFDCYFRAPGLTSGLKESVNVNRTALLLVPQ